MKKRNLFLMLAAVVCCMCAAACNKDNDTETTPTTVVTQDENSGGAPSDTQGGGDTTGYQFIPLEQYLPGEWRLDPNCVVVHGALESGWQRFHDTYYFEIWSTTPHTPEESIIFDTAGNIVFRKTDRADFTTTYYLTGDSTKVGIMDTCAGEIYDKYFLEINADSMAVYPYTPEGIYIMVLQAYLFYRVRQ